MKLWVIVGKYVGHTTAAAVTERQTDRERVCVCLCAARLNLVSIKFAHDNTVNIIRMQCTFLKS